MVGVKKSHDESHAEANQISANRSEIRAIEHNLDINEPERELKQEIDSDKSISSPDRPRSTDSGDDVPEDSKEAPGQQDLERSATTRSKALTIVPRSKRRGLFAFLALIPEVERPYDYSRPTKWLITFIVAMAAVASPLGSSIVFPALKDVAEDFHASSTVTNLNISMYMIAMSIFPLWWSSFSERFGRRNIYIISFALYVLWAILSAVSNSIGMFIVMRLLSGGAAASVQAVGAGTIADIWEPRERGQAMGYFYLGPLLGPLLAPIIGGAITQSLGWRSTQWFQVIYGGLVFLGILFALPETLAKKPLIFPAEQPVVYDENGKPALARVSTRQSAKMKTAKATQYFKSLIVEPLSVLGYLRFEVVAATVCMTSICFGSLYILATSIQQTFAAAPYNYSVTIIGLLYIPNSVGYLIASVLGGKWTDYIMHREARLAGRYDEEGNLIFNPEDRMRENVWLAAIIYPASLLWYGWTADQKTSIAAPMVANFFFGCGSMIIFGASTTALTEFMPRRSSSGVAINNFMRNIFSAVGSFITSPAINHIGNGWLFTTFAIAGWTSSIGVVWSLKRFGPKWRVRMEKRMAE